MLNVTIDSTAQKNGSSDRGRNRSRLVAELASSPSAVREAQSLRHDVFKAEYGVVFDSGDGLDHDDFDRWCRHLLVRDQESGQVVATTRLMTRYHAARAGRFYSELEFDLSGLLQHLEGSILEIGRTCVHSDYRSGGAIATLWTALAELLMEEEHQFLMGCASIPLHDGGVQYEAIMRRLREQHWSDESLRVQPLLSVQTSVSPAEVVPMMPPLLRTYMRMGATICGEGCWDPAFNCADVFVLLDVARLDQRYAQRFMGRSVASCSVSA